MTRREGQYIVFDALGAKKETLSELKLTHAEKNDSVYQCDSSKLCGQFCLYVFFMLLFNPDRSYKQCLQEYFSPNCSTNDNIVTKFYECGQIYENGGFYA